MPRWLRRDRVEAISVEGGDLLARAGSPPPSVPHIVGYLPRAPSLRSVPGSRTGGRRPVVTLNMAGSHAAKRAVPAISTWPIPEGLDAAAAACVPVAVGTAQECLFTAGNLEAGQTALIQAVRAVSGWRRSSSRSRQARP